MIECTRFILQHSFATLISGEHRLCGFDVKTAILEKDFLAMSNVDAQPIEARSPLPATTPLIELRNISKRFGNVL